MEIQIDRETLPKDGQRVKWQTQNDIENNNWKEGVFCEGDDFFCVGFDDTHSDWNLSWDVVSWQSLP